MAYSVYCYFNTTIDDSSSYIETTNIKAVKNGTTIYHTGEYGDSQYELHDVTGYTEFTAYPSDDGEFYRWAYHLGSPTSTTQYTDDNPFLYTGTENIYIRAEGVPAYVEPDVPDAPLVEYWYWDASNGTASENQTIASYNAVVNKEVTTNFSYKVWNDLVDKVDAILEFAGIEWNEKYDTYRNTLMKSTDKELTARRFNSLRLNIDYGRSTEINIVDAGDEVLADYFLTFASRINEFIDLLS